MIIDVPLNFWLNDAARLALPEVHIPYGERRINIDLSDLNAQPA